MRRGDDTLPVEEHLKAGDFLEGVRNAMQYLEGSYCLLILRKNKLIAVRDPRGLRPLCIGKFKDGYAISSESCAFASQGISLERDAKPGEVLLVYGNNIKSFPGIKKSISKTNL